MTRAFNLAKMISGSQVALPSSPAPAGAVRILASPDGANKMVWTLLPSGGGVGGGGVNSVNGDSGPDVLLQTGDIGESAGLFFITQTEIDKLAAIQSGAEVNVQSDWDAGSGDSHILNKPVNITAIGANGVTVDYIPVADGAGGIVWQAQGTGASGSAFLTGTWTFDDTTDGVPASGEVTTETGEIEAAATHIRVWDSDNAPANFGDILAALQEDDVIFVQQKSNANNFASMTLTGAVTDNGTYVELPVSIVLSATAGAGAWPELVMWLPEPGTGSPFGVASVGGLTNVVAVSDIQDMVLNDSMTFNTDPNRAQVFAHVFDPTVGPSGEHQAVLLNDITAKLPKRLVSEGATQYTVTEEDRGHLIIVDEPTDVTVYFDLNANEPLPNNSIVYIQTRTTNKVTIDKADPGVTFVYNDTKYVLETLGMLEAPIACRVEDTDEIEIFGGLALATP